jgi:hypothetical protein
MGLSWTTKLSSIDEIKKAIDSCIKKSRIPPFANIAWESNELVIRVDNSGKSEFRFSVDEANGCSIFKEIRRDVALLHRPFVGTVENIVDKVLHDAGFTKA